VQLSAAGGAGPQADAKSVLAVMQLGASSGAQVTVRAVGPDAEKAVETLVGILAAVSKAGE
jgi:phosphotransferase system HPr (HPr) family protein